MGQSESTDTAAKPAEIDWQSELSRHDQWLRSVVYARVGEPQAVDDVMQNVALAAVRQQAPLADPTKVAPWLYRLAVTQSLLHRRSMGRRRNLKKRYTEKVRPQEHDSGGTDPLGWLLADERRDLVRKALKSLSGKDAEILLLKYKEDKSYKEMATLLGTTTSAVESRLHRARGRLRKKLMAMEVVETA